MGQMRQMQMSMTDMRSHLGQGNGGGEGGGVGGPLHQSSSVPYGGFGSGYGGGYGGGKMHQMPMSMYGGRSMPYNMRVPKHPGE